MWNRRSFLTLAGAGAFSLSSCGPRAAETPGEAAQAASEGRIVINSLGGLSDANADPNSEGVTRRAVDDALASGMNAVNITLGYVAGPDDPYQTSLKEIGEWDAIVAGDPRLMKVLTAADIRRAKEEKRLGLIYGFQNSAQMGDDAGRVDEFAKLGMRVIQLTYNIANQLGGGALAPPDMPLNAFGREVVARLNAAKVIVDLSHSGERTCLDAAAASGSPIAITHTGCRALADLPRNKTDEELRAVTDRGGYVGIYFMPFLADGRQITGDDVVNHIDHAVNVCGEDHVGIGTDGGTSGIDDMEKWKTAFEADINRRRSLGISAPGERPDSYTFAIDMTGPEQFRILADKLGKRGYPASRIDKVLGLNFLRFAEGVWGG